MALEPTGAVTRLRQNADWAAANPSSDGAGELSLRAKRFHFGAQR